MSGFYFMFGNNYSDEIGLMVEGTPDIGVAQRDGELVSIPGKDGDDYVDYGRYKNVEFSLNVALVQKGSKTVREMIDDIINEYAYLQGYQYFEASDHPDLSTEACIINFGDFRRDLKRVGQATLQFSRKPFWYNLSGVSPQDVSLLPEIPTKVFTNPYKLISKPIIEIKTTPGPPVAFQFSITDPDGTETEFGGTNISGGATVVIDCEKETFKVDGIFAAFNIPKGFVTGDNVFKLLFGKSRISSIKIMPRWRCL